MKKYQDISTTDFPKTLIVRNHVGGAGWQVYHVQKLSEVEKLTENCWNNGFYGSTLENYTGEKETWSDWRETEEGKIICA
jgi:hypothetical protein